MHGNLPANAQRAIFSDPTSQNEKSGRTKKSDISEFSFRRLAEALFPKKTPAHLEFLSGEARGTWYDRLQNDRDPPAGSLVRLLHSTEGGRVLHHLMRGCQSGWWRDHLAGEICLAGQRRIDAEIKQLELGL